LKKSRNKEKPISDQVKFQCFSKNRESAYSTNEMIRISNIFLYI